MTHKITKKGKELKMDSFKNYSIVFGSVNNKIPRALYINISTWAQPKSPADSGYTRIIKDLHKKIKQSLYDYLDKTPDTDFLKDRSIIDLDIRESGVKYGKRSFTNCELTLFMRSEIPVNSEKMIYILDGLIKHIIDVGFDSNRAFKFYRKKA